LGQAKSFMAAQPPPSWRASLFDKFHADYIAI
jgi:hypothetical protein